MRWTVLVACVFLGAPAFAQCPSDAIQRSADIHVAAQAPEADPEASTAVMDTLAKSCVTNPFVQKVAAMFHGAATAKAKTPDIAFSHAVAAWNYYAAMRKAAEAGTGQAPVNIKVKGENFPLDIYAADNLDQMLLRNLFIAELKTQTFVADHAPLQPGEKPRACTKSDPIDAQVAARLIEGNAKGDVSPALNLLDRISAACAPVIETGYNRRILGLRAGAIHALLLANPNRPDALDLLAKAEADSRRVFELNPEGDKLYWTKEQRDALAKTIAERRAP